MDREDRVAAFRVRVRKELDGRGMTQGKLARAIGVEGPAVSKWLSGRTEPSYGQLRKMEDELDLGRGTLLWYFGYVQQDLLHSPLPPDVREALDVMIGYLAELDASVTDLDAHRRRRGNADDPDPSPSHQSDQSEQDVVRTISAKTGTPPAVPQDKQAHLKAHVGERTAPGSRGAAETGRPGNSEDEETPPAQDAEEETPRNGGSGKRGRPKP